MKDESKKMLISTIIEIILFVILLSLIMWKIQINIFDQINEKVEIFSLSYSYSYVVTMCGLYELVFWGYTIYYTIKLWKYVAKKDEKIEELSDTIDNLKKTVKSIKEITKKITESNENN